MVYFFLNILMYLIIIIFMIRIFKDKLNIYGFIIILFNLNVYLFFIIQNINFIYGLVLSIMSYLFYSLIYNLDINNQEVILIKKGNINFHELMNNYSYFKLKAYLKLKKINIDEIEYCIKKGNKLVVIKNNEINNYPISIILDGKILTENLDFINKTSDWLKEELLENNLLVKNIDYAYYKNKKIFFNLLEK